jgi:tetratricopeptide (TPR) repeat protein
MLTVSSQRVLIFLTMLTLISCTGRENSDEFKQELASIDLLRGDITLCGSGADEFGSVSFAQSCSEKTKVDFDLATALLHSFEYTEAEKVYARVIDQDPSCVMAYWGVAMSNFHPLWMAPGPAELEKGTKVIALARSIISDTSSRESDYIEAIATIYDDWKILDHRTRVLKFEEASRKNYKKYSNDDEAAIFYALALAAAADPADKTFKNQKKAGEILNAIFTRTPDHPGIAHYIIHNYDYPELAELGLPAARKYAAIAAASAHAQHMPSHIFIRLGLWDEAIQSNINSVTAAQCYAQTSGIKGHWDEELHGLDYLTYAYLQNANDEKALEQINYLKTIREVFPINFKDAYCFASMPARYAVERKDWEAAAKLQLEPSNFPWDKFLWEKSNLHFARILGMVRTGKLNEARQELMILDSIHLRLSQQKESYKANLVQIQSKASLAWIRLKEGKKDEAITLLKEAVAMEEGTAKHPVTPGEIIPARELLGDLYFEMKDYSSALKEYEADLKRHPNKFNGLYGAAVASEKSGDKVKAEKYFQEVMKLSEGSSSDRPQLRNSKSFL